eukprot:5415968-Pleurochrysis_carterae.AAC.1
MFEAGASGGACASQLVTVERVGAPVAVGGAERVGSLLEGLVDVAFTTAALAEQCVPITLASR